MENVIFWKFLYLPTKLAGSVISEIDSFSGVSQEVYLAAPGTSSNQGTIPSKAES